MARRRKKKGPPNLAEQLESCVLQHSRARGRKKEVLRRVIDALLEDLMLTGIGELERVVLTHNGKPVRGSRGLLEELLKDL